MYTISKDFAFSASHQLTTLPKDHPCSRLHGHNYTVRIELSSAVLDAHGFVLDYGDLAAFGRWVDAHLDHRHLNEAMSANPTAENLAHLLSSIVSIKVDLPVGTVVSGVGVSETPKTWAWWRP
jgi:6-pyruvoyltetrahydropterin/6-carboxytetrahydropterin synthase